MGVYKRGTTYWYRFTFAGELIRQSTKQSNLRIARQMEAAHKTSLAKGEVGLRDRKQAPTLAEFASTKFAQHVNATFAAKVKTQKNYQNGIKALLAYDILAKLPLDAITTDKIAASAAKRQQDGLQISSVNRELQVLRRLFA